jgi:hypothetical protein
MAARTVHPVLQFPSVPNPIAIRERLRASARQAALRDRPLGAFRGLAYAIAFQFLVGFAGYAGWVLLRHLR